MRIAAGIEYDGSAFAGWQCQPGMRTVQEQLEGALSRVADQPVRAITAGRTDAGVHACAQVVHFDCDAPRDARAWVRGVTSYLPADVALWWAQPVGDDFHARYSAIERRYCYVILNRPRRPTWLRHGVGWDYRALDEQRMQAAAAPLLGRHDFSAFRAAGCQARSPVRELRRLQVDRHGEYIFVQVHADAFLQHMVRTLVGTLSAVGAGERPVEWVAEVLATRDRHQGGITASPHGLYLTGVLYPERFAIPPPPGFHDLPGRGFRKVDQQ